MENCRKLKKKKNSLKTYHWYQKRFLHTCITPKAVEDNLISFLQHTFSIEYECMLILPV